MLYSTTKLTKGELLFFHLPNNEKALVFWTSHAQNICCYLLTVTRLKWAQPHIINISAALLSTIVLSKACSITTRDTFVEGDSATRNKSFSGLRHFRFKFLGKLNLHKSSCQP